MTCEQVSDHGQMHEYMGPAWSCEEVDTRLAKFDNIRDANGYGFGFGSGGWTSTMCFCGDMRKLDTLPGSSFVPHTHPRTGAKCPPPGNFMERVSLLSNMDPQMIQWLGGLDLREKE